MNLNGVLQSTVSNRRVITSQVEPLQTHVLTREGEGTGVYLRFRYERVARCDPDLQGLSFGLPVLLSRTTKCDKMSDLLT